MYDMFVGGVSTAGEHATLTAAREVAEELGLKRALVAHEMKQPLEERDTGGHQDHALQVGVDSSQLDTTGEGGALSHALFRCTVCTSYNRCVVTVFTYRFISEVEHVTWQKEEVAWGDFIPYRIVHNAAACSIQRLKDAGTWPATGTDEDALGMNDSFRYEGHDWEEWDFVPDGLLVWKAWLQWMSE